MTQEALRMALEALENNKPTHLYCEDIWYSCPKHEDGCANEAEGDECNCGADEINAEFDKAITAIKEALAQTERHELQAKGEHPAPCARHCEAPAFGIVIKNLKAQLAQTQEPVAWMYQCTADNSEPVLLRKKQNWAESGTGLWVETSLYTSPPQHTERPVDCERCNRLEEHAYDLIGKLRVANIKLSMQPQRTWVGLTDEEVRDLWSWSATSEAEKTANTQQHAFARAIEAKLKEKNT